VLIIGHRGSPTSAPENTVAGFESALAEGADGVELDLRLTADGHLVCLHDADLERTTDGAGPVAEHTLAAVRELDAGAHFDGAGGHPFAGRGVRVPTLAEALDAVPAPHLVDLEVKVPRGGRPPEATVEALAAALAGRADSGRLVVSTFSSDLARLLVPAVDPVPVGLLTTTLAPIGLAASSAMRAGCRLLVANEGAYRWPGTRAAVAWATRSGCRLAAWTVDEPAMAARLGRLGLWFAISNHPGAVKQP
jgi:glycerophosphoryl diester phosphodiesterase